MKGRKKRGLLQGLSRSQNLPNRGGPTPRINILRGLAGLNGSQTDNSSLLKPVFSSQQEKNVASFKEIMKISLPMSVEIHIKKTGEDDGMGGHGDIIRVGEGQKSKVVQLDIVQKQNPTHTLVRRRRGKRKSSIFNSLGIGKLLSGLSGSGKGGRRGSGSRGKKGKASGDDPDNPRKQPWDMQPAELQQHWKALQQICGSKDKKSELIKLQEKEIDVITHSIFNFEKLYLVDGDNKSHELQITFKDYMIKLLNFIEFWEQKGADIEATKFFIKVIYRLIENEIPPDEDEEEETEIDDEERKKMFERMKKHQDDLNELDAPVICIKLIWHATIYDHKENSYLSIVLRFLNLLLEKGNTNVQNSIYNKIFLTNRESEKFF
jgi:hypothetical protein